MGLRPKCRDAVDDAPEALVSLEPWMARSDGQGAAGKNVAFAAYAHDNAYSGSMHKSACASEEREQRDQAAQKTAALVYVK